MTRGVNRYSSIANSSLQRQLTASTVASFLWGWWVHGLFFPLAFLPNICSNPSPRAGLCISRAVGGVLLKAFQPSVRVFYSQECFDAMRRCDMTFGVRADVSQCLGQVQFWDDWPRDHYMGRDEHVNQVHLAGWLYRHLSGLHWEWRG